MTYRGEGKYPERAEKKSPKKVNKQHNMTLLVSSLIIIALVMGILTIDIVRTSNAKAKLNDSLMEQLALQNSINSIKYDIKTVTSPERIAISARSFGFVNAGAGQTVSLPER